MSRIRFELTNHLRIFMNGEFNLRTPYASYTSLIIMIVAISYFTFIIPSSASNISDTNRTAFDPNDRLALLPFGSRPIASDHSEQPDPDSDDSDDGSEEILITSKDMNTADLDLIKLQFLRKMGLTERPPPSLEQPPIYLWDIYENMVQTTTTTSNSLFTHFTHVDDSKNFTLIHQRPHYDIVRTFLATGNPEWASTLRFDLRGLESNERWIRAELRVPWQEFQNETLEFNNETADRNLTQDNNSYLRINLYEMINETLDIRNLIDTKLFSLHRREAESRNSELRNPWVTFDVISIIQRVTLRTDILKLCVEFIHYTHDRGRESRFLNWNESTAWNSTALLMYGFQDDGTMQDTWKYKIDQSSSPPMNIMRRKRQTKNQPTQNRHRASNNRPRLQTNQSNRQSSNRRSQQQQIRNQNLCQRRRLIIRFEDLNWQDWILAPQEYAAYYCSGQCVYPFADGQNATNHAIVQALVNSVSQRTAPKPCCVPTDTSPISLLYTDLNKNIVIKNYPDMVVEGCGCR